MLILGKSAFAVYYHLTVSDTRVRGLKYKAVHALGCLDIMG